MRIEFDPAPFVRSHGAAPRGRGSWAFAFEGCGPLFSPGGMTLAEARSWVRGEVKAAAPADFTGTVVVEVLP